MQGSTHLVATPDKPYLQIPLLIKTAIDQSQWSVSSSCLFLPSGYGGQFANQQLSMWLMTVDVHFDDFAGVLHSTVTVF